MIAVLDYGMGNLRSVTRAVQHAGGRVRLARSPKEVDGATGLIVPGVGAFGACMSNLAAQGLDAAIVSFAASGRPVLGVCLGMQVLFEWSEEGEVDGLGLLAGKVRRLPSLPSVKVPHMGWNEVRWTRAHPFTEGLAQGTRFYFVHAYACEAAPEITVGETEHGIRFAAVVAQDNVFATQFHPEKSSRDGLVIYEAFVGAVAAGEDRP